MFNVNFASIAECLKVNNLTEAQLVHHIKKYMDNQNYRTDYNSRKNQLFKQLKNDPIVAKRLSELRKKA